MESSLEIQFQRRSMSDPTRSDIGFKNKMVRYELPLILTKNGIPCENPSKNHGFDVCSLERDENSEPRPRNIFASLAHNANFYPRF